MRITRRKFLGVAAGTTGATLLETVASARTSDVPASIGSQRPMTDDIVPISDEERRGRIEKARRLMVENGIDAIYYGGRLQPLLLHRRALGQQ